MSDEVKDIYQVAATDKTTNEIVIDVTSVVYFGANPSKDTIRMM